ncbi:NAD(P)H-binding protein [Actinophytocola sp. NPDC049390]|uniref:NAD(P)H-binding protein n=1 Tax=Actinophytocola sp. NPDC049390 TaxID=3363894 RepID=UPI0037B598AC
MNTLILGANGKTGRRVAERLTTRGVPVRRGTRAGAPPFDWERPDTWAPVLAGVDAVYVSYFPDLAVPGAVDAIRELTGLAEKAGVRRLVLLSGRGEAEAQVAEDVVRAGSVEWTVVRCAWFNQNFSESYLLDPLLAGDVVLPAGDVTEPFVDADDIADVAVAALTEPGHGGRTYEMTGPRLLTFADAVAEIAEATGRPLTYRRMDLDEYVTAATGDGLPSDVAELLGYLFGEVLDGRNAWVGDGVEQALGRPAKDFATFARENRAVWLPAAQLAR